MTPFCSGSPGFRRDDGNSRVASTSFAVRRFPMVQEIAANLGDRRLHLAELPSAGSIDHNLPQEAPATFATAALTLAWRGPSNQSYCRQPGLGRDPFYLTG